MFDPNSTFMKYISILSLCTKAATLAELLSQDPQLSLASSQAKDFPQWSDLNSQGTLIVARDAAIRANPDLPKDNYGIFYHNRTVVWSTVHYVILEGVQRNMKMVFDNYAPGDGESKFEVHIRGYGLVNQVLQEHRRADNGMLYIAPDPVIPVVLPSRNLGLIGSNKFRDLINSLGMQEFVDKLNDITIFSPTDEAFTAFEPTLNSYTKVQKEAFVLNHIVPRVIYTISIVPRINSLLSQPVTLRVGGDRIRVNEDSNITISDNMMLNGVAQLINGVLAPSSLPNDQVRVNIDGNQWPSTPSTTTGSTNTTTGSNTNSGPSKSGIVAISFLPLSVFMLFVSLF